MTFKNYNSNMSFQKQRPFVLDYPLYMQSAVFIGTISSIESSSGENSSQQDLWLIQRNTDSVSENRGC